MGINLFLYFSKLFFTLENIAIVLNGKKVHYDAVVYKYSSPYSHIY